MAALFDLVTVLSLIVVVLVMALILLIRWFRDRVQELESRLQAADTAKRSQAATYGRITEQFAPFMAGYPFDPKNFRFLGNPIDGVQFEEDRVVFVEIKGNTSRLSQGEERIRRLVEAGRVEWFEFRADERTAPAGGPGPRTADPSAGTENEPRGGPDFWRR